MATYKFFNPTQDPKMVGVIPALMTLLDQARGISGVPYIITSGLRTVSQNNALANAVVDSAHLTGEAVDLAYTTTTQRLLILKGLYAVGFRRLGMGLTFIHCDVSKTLPQDVFFLEDGLTH
jgi:hypothetical protein